MVRTLAALPILAAVTAGPTLANEVRCPASLTVQAQPEAPGGWSPYPAKDQHAFAGVALVEGDRAAQMTSPTPPPAPAALEPDRSLRRGRSETRQWDFPAARRTNVFLICRYSGTQATLAIDLPRTVRRCQITEETDARGIVLDKPAAAPQFLCR
ncbi:STY0301 family protein [Azospirillum tabaci]|uniref:STY0301 family protein n=1 Tax=Azospirillum tabaci TaxID=2752310 RepID=UPI001660888B|nr:STY0301 family protein [Azospirillum tabaci]